MNHHTPRPPRVLPQPSVDQVAAFISGLSDAEQRSVEEKSGQCCVCFFTRVGHCNHLTERAADRRLMQTRINIAPIFSHLFDRAQDPRNTPANFSPIEIRLLEAFWARGLDPETQYPIGPFTADFAFPAALLVVEADGRKYHQDAEREERRDGYLRRQGWIVRHFRGWQIFKDADACVMRVYDLARQT